MAIPLQKAANNIRKYGSGLTEIGGVYSDDKVPVTNQVSEEGRFTRSDQTAGLTKKAKAAKSLRKVMTDIGSTITRPRQY